MKPQLDPALPPTERYRRIRQKLIRFFTRKDCSDPEDLADETILRALIALNREKEITCQLETFLFGIAKNVTHETLRHEGRQEPLDDLPAGREPIIDPRNDLELPLWGQQRCLACLQHCRQECLTQEENDLICEYYRGEKEGEQKRIRIDLAGRLGITLKALHARALRIREKLEKCIKVCLNRLGAE